MGDRLGFASHAFDYKGVILLPPGGGIESLEAAEEAAIMAEAEEVEQMENEEGYKLFQVRCTIVIVEFLQQNMRITHFIVWTS